MDNEPKGRAKGGIARAMSMSPEKRAEQARNAATARWEKQPPKAIAEGTLVIGKLKISCAVLDDGKSTRVLTQEGFLEAIGRAPKAKGGEGTSVDGLPPFMRAANLKPFISNELEESTTSIDFITLRGQKAFGYKASLLPNVCWVYQDAFVAGKLLPGQTHIGVACGNFLKALTNHAIEDLVDQATGFEDFRKRKALDKIIEQFVEKDAQPWVKMFPLDFYRHIYRLNNWPFDPENTRRPGVVGKWTNDIYDRLAPGIRQALHDRVRRNSKGKPTQKLTAYLTPEVGKPHLERLLEGVVLLMRMAPSWADFRLALNQYYPRYNETLPLDFNGERIFRLETGRTSHIPALQDVKVAEKRN